MDIARDICTDIFYIVNSGLPCIPVTAVNDKSSTNKILDETSIDYLTSMEQCQDDNHMF